MGATFSVVEPPLWDARPVAVVGAGPSLKGFDFSRLKGPWYVVAVNQKIWDLPWADAAFSLDVPWQRRIAAEAVKIGPPLYLAVPDCHPPLHKHVDGAIYVRKLRDPHSRLVEARDAISGATSGFGAINLAYHKRPKLLVLFGFDYAAKNVGHDKPEQYPWHPRGHNAMYWPRWATDFDAAKPQLKAAGIEVVNACPDSNVTAFPRCSVDDGVAALHSLALT